MLLSLAGLRIDQLPRLLLSHGLFVEGWCSVSDRRRRSIRDIDRV